jgi:phage tail sheath protein FI
MPTYSTPGVYFEWLDTRADYVDASRTDIAGFVGIAERGVLQQPVRIESWAQFTTTFGGLSPAAFLAYAVQGFFNNGGRRCWVVRAADSATASPSKATLTDSKGTGVVAVTAYSPGVWAQQINITVVNTGAQRFNLTVRLLDGTQEFWPNLTFDPKDPRYVERVINDSRKGSRLIQIRVNLTKDSSPSLADGTAPMSGGNDGLANIIRGGVDKTTQTLVDAMITGLSTLEEIDEVAIVVMPDAVVAPRYSPKFKVPAPNCALLDQPAVLAAPAAAPSGVPLLGILDVQTLQSALIQHCEKLKDRIAILDAPASDLTPVAIRDWRNKFTSQYAALYYPWIKVPDPLGVEGLVRAIPPSGVVAGIYAQVERRVGPHKPPANEPLENVEDVSHSVNDLDHGFLNELGINVIRPFNGRRIRVAGARTLVASDNTQWLFVNVRRLVLMIERSIEVSTQWMVFEPNNPDLWLEIDRVIRSFLDGLWKKGFLDGASAEEAYSVKCDSSTNPPPETDNGRVICEIGLLPPWPAEFVIVRIGITPSGAEVLNAMEAQSV